MKNIKNIVSGVMLLSLFAGGLLINVAPVSADNDKNNSNSLFSNMHASLKADSMMRVETSTGVVFGTDGSLKVLGAKVVSVSATEISANTLFGNSVLNFVVKIDADTKVNGRNSYPVIALKAGDRISFSGKMLSSTATSMVIDADHLVSRALFDLELRTNFKGKIQTINLLDNSFTIKLKDKAVKVNTNASTLITLNKVTTTLAFLSVGNEVKIVGELNPDGTVITATKVMADNDNDDDKDDNDDDKDKNNNGKKNGWYGKMKHWFWK